MRALKAFVIGMAILLTLGMVVVVVTIVQRADEVGAPAPATASSPTPVAALSSFDKSRIVLPAGAEIVDMVAEGERLVLRLKLAGGGERLVILDMGSGRQLGTVELERAP